MRIKTLVALYFWILEFDDVTCIRSIPTQALRMGDRCMTLFGGMAHGRMVEQRNSGTAEQRNDGTAERHDRTTRWNGGMTE